MFFDDVPPLIGFRVLGGPESPRRPVDWRDAFGRHCEADDRCEPARESFLSLFHFGDGVAFLEHLGRSGSVRGYAGPVGAEWLAFDIDRPGDPETARADCVRLAVSIAERYHTGEDDLLAFFSGGKGYHLQAPFELFGSPPPSLDFAKVAKALALQLAAGAGVAVDSIYESVRLFRSPNSRHGKTGLYKIPLTVRELSMMPAARHAELAREPRPIELREAPLPCAVAVADWQTAVEHTEAVRRPVQPPPGDRSELNALTLQILADQIIPEGGGGPSNSRPTGGPLGAFDAVPAPGRHKTLYSCARDLAELGADYRLAWALLGKIGLQSGLNRADVERQIQCGVRDARGGSA